MMITISREGRRSYFNGDTFPLKNELRNIGAHWDSESRRWWIGSKSAAEEFIFRHSDPELMQKLKKENQLNHARNNILGRATFEKQSYYLVGRGNNTARGNWVLLMLRDGSSTFFKSLVEVEITKTYRKPMTFDSIQAFAEQKKLEQSTGICQCKCHFNQQSSDRYGSSGWALFDGCDRCGCEDDG